MLIKKRYSVSFESLIMLCIYGWAFLYIHFEVNRDNHFVRARNLQEIVIEDVDYLQSLTNQSKKYPISGIAIIQAGTHRFTASCMGMEQFCQVHQLTPLPQHSRVTLLWVKNTLDHSEMDIKTVLVKEIRTPDKVLVSNGKTEIERYIASLQESCVLGWLIELFALIPCVWIIVKIFRNIND